MRLERDEGNGGWPVGVRSVPSERRLGPYDLSLKLASLWRRGSSHVVPCPPATLSWPASERCPNLLPPHSEVKAPLCKGKASCIFCRLSVGAVGEGGMTGGTLHYGDAPAVRPLLPAACFVFVLAAASGSVVLRFDRYIRNMYGSIHIIIIPRTPAACEARPSSSEWGCFSIYGPAFLKRVEVPSTCSSCGVRASHQSI